MKDDGLWIKELVEESIYIIHAKKFDKNELRSITISEMIAIMITKIQSQQKKQTLSQKIEFR